MWSLVRWVFYVKNSWGWFTAGLCLQKKKNNNAHTQTKGTDSLLRRLNEEAESSPLHKFALTHTKTMRRDYLAARDATRPHIMRALHVWHVTCRWGKKKASPAIWSSRWLVHGPLTTRACNVTCKWQLPAALTWHLFHHQSGKASSPPRAGLTRFTPLLTFVTAGIKRGKKKIPCCQVDRFFGKAAATPVSSSWLPDIFPQCLLANLKLSVHQTWLLKPCPQSFS